MSTIARADGEHGVKSRTHMNRHGSRKAIIIIAIVAVTIMDATLRVMSYYCTLDRGDLGGLLLLLQCRL